jgi:hypothetical protein
MLDYKYRIKYFERMWLFPKTELRMLLVVSEVHGTSDSEDLFFALNVMKRDIFSFI